MQSCVEEESNKAVRRRYQYLVDEFSIHGDTKLLGLESNFANLDTTGKKDISAVYRKKLMAPIRSLYRKEQCECEMLSISGKLPLRRLSILNISKQTNSRNLKELLSRYGQIQEYKVKSERWCGRNRRHAFVAFSSVQEALRVKLDATNLRIVLDNRILKVVSWNPSVESCESGDIEISPCFGQVCPKTGRTRNDGDRKIDMLNDDCLIQIFLHLPILDRIRVERVCKRWQAASKASWTYVGKLTLLQWTWGRSSQFKFKKIDSKMLRNVLQRCGSHLKEIHISYTIDRSYSDSLSDFAEFCPNLQVINASKIVVSANSIKMLSRKCRDIRSLSLNRLDGPCDSALTELFKQSPKLTHFMGCEFLDGECLRHLPRTTIREIVLTDLTKLGLLDHLTRALPEFENLSTLAIYNKIRIFGKSVLPAEIVEALGRHCKHLKRFEVRGFKLAVPRCGMLITELTILEVLILQMIDINDDFLKRLSPKCQKLTHLDLSNCSSVTWVGIAALAALPKLSKLILNQWSYVDLPPKEWTGIQGLRFGQLPRTNDFPSLTYLECRRCYILSPSEICCLIESSPLLQLVDLSDYYYASEKILEALIAYTLAGNSKTAFKVSCSDV